ncbi:leucine-rich repeat domain-containing protein [Candidatus Poribacteria bacterium]|nr:leucine-rich repeat domain-containing protein [Candidatus Poribacteria bacterium]
MKSTLYSIITLLIFLTLTFVSNGFAQKTSPEYVVRQVYFHPSDRQPPQDRDATLDALVNNVQQFYANEMERHGFGRKTFRLETDALGKTVRHYIKGKFTSDHYGTNIINKAANEINEQLDQSKGHLLYLIWYDQEDTLLASSQVGGNAGGFSFGGTANILLLSFEQAPKILYRRAFNTIAHELGHAFGLPHDFRDDRYMMSYGPEELKDQLSYCAAEWLDAHRYFNTTHNAFDKVPTIQMLPPSFVSPPNTVRFQFKITHSEGLHQAQLLTNSFSWPGNPVFDSTTLLDCKSLKANDTTIEFVTTELALASEYVVLRVIDEHGNFTSRRFPLDVNSLFPDSEPVLIPDANLAALIRKTLSLRSTSPITKLDMLGLGELHFYEDDRNHFGLPPPPGKEITELTGLQHATNLENLRLNDHQIVDLTPLAELTQLKRLAIERNRINDISPLAGLTQLRSLGLSGNQISDVGPLERLTRLSELVLNDNQIEDLTPLKELKNLRILDIYGNQVTDRTLTLLTEFPKLVSLGLRINQIRDISPIAKLTNLISLALEGNQISDITSLAGLTNLTHLWLDANQISDITPLAELTNLQVLALNDNQITDITPLTKLTNLRLLNLNDNRVSNASSLVGLVNLEFLGLTENPIKNRKPLLALLRKNPDVEIWLKPGDTPLPVTLSHFRAELTDTGAILKWTTESEIDNAGFYIYRSETRTGEFKVVNPTMVQGAGTTSERHTYTWTDTTAKPNTVYYYQIEDISHAGVRKQLATVRMRGLVSASGKLTTRWADLKTQN